MKHPNQPIVLAEDGCIRFQKNEIVRKLLDFATARGYSLNEIAQEFYNSDDYVQLMQLIGYSVSGFGDLSCAPKKLVRKADKIEEKMCREIEKEKKKNG